MSTYMKPGQPWLYDSTTGDIVGVKDADGGETMFAAWNPTNTALVHPTTGRDSVYPNPFNSSVITQSKASSMITDSVFDITPTYFCDLSATASGSGTLASPWTAAQATAAFTGNQSGKTLGVKRGSVLNGSSMSFNVYGAIDTPCRIVPYGSALAAPLIDAKVVTTTWAQDGTYPQLWKITGLGSECDAWESDVRYFKKTSAANAVAAGPGFSYYSAGTLYIYPITSNPNLGQVSIASATNGLLINYTNVSKTGGIILAGLHVRGSKDSAVKIYKPTVNAAITAIENIQLIGNIMGQAGADNFALGLGADAACVYGLSDTVRIKYGYSGGNYSYDTLNNAMEMACIDGWVHEWNESAGCGGNAIIELWGSQSNCVVKYNKGVGTGNAYAAAAGYHQSGIWQTDYIGNDGSTASTQSTNANNEFSFNSISNVARIGIDLFSSNGNKVYNNTIIACSDTAGGFRAALSVANSVASNASTATGNTVDIRGNIIVNSSSGVSQLTANVGNFEATQGVTNSGCTMTGDNNFYYNGIGSGNAMESYLPKDTVSYSVKYTTMSTWTAAQATIDQASHSKNPAVDYSTTKPLLGSPIVGKGYLPTGYYVDLAGHPLRGPVCGCYQP